MKIVWEYSPRLEALHLLQVAHNVANGFFKTNHFLVLPDQNPHVVLPDLPYLSIPRFWNQAAKVKIISTPDIQIIAPADLIAQSTKLIKSLSQPNFTQVQSNWSKIQNRVISEIYHLIPSKKNWIKKITIWPTSFGTGCSFSLLKNPGEIQIWLRADQNVSAIVEAILTALTRYDVFDNLSGLWSESEIVVDWLLAYSPLAKLITYQPATIKSTRSFQNATLSQKSTEFLAKIGAPPVSPAQIDTSTFSSSEKQLFDLLLSRSPNIVPFSDISASLYSASKSIQRLRDRLESAGLSASFIQTKRGEGYLLTN